MSDCYARIAALKRSHDPAADFFPGIGPDQRFLLSRNEVNAVMQGQTGVAMQREMGTEETASVRDSP